MKGVSPLVATVLLIAATVAIAGIISVWLTSFTRTTTTSVETTATNQTKCAGAYLKIDSVSRNITPSAYNATVIYSNPSPQTITNINFFATPGNETFYNVTTTLTSGNATSANLTLTTSTKITIKGICLSTVVVEGTCTSSDTCWKI